MLGLETFAESAAAFANERAFAASDLTALILQRHRDQTTLFCERCPRRPVAHIMRTRLGTVITGYAWHPVNHQGQRSADWRGSGNGRGRMPMAMERSALILDGPFSGVAYFGGLLSCPRHGELTVPPASELLAMGPRGALRLKGSAPS